MNKIEKEMFDLVTTLKDSYGAVGLKAEFEAEGTRVEELLRLLEIGHRSGMKLALKIGGCEAVRDLIEAKQFGVNYIIAPMVESSYALSKFIDAKNKVYSVDERDDIEFLVNIETNKAYEDLIDIAKASTVNNGIQGLVFGRVDFVGSMGLNRNDVDNPDTLKVALKIAEASKSSGLDLVVGGGISQNAVDFLREVRKVHLSRFETRKVVFSADALDLTNFDRALLVAVHFELLWLINKREYYDFIKNEDQRRIEMLEARWNVLSKKY